MNKCYGRDDGFLPLDPDSDIAASLRSNILSASSGSAKIGIFEEALSADAPYPPAKAVTHNEKYAELIRGSFSGRESELSSAASCLYHGLKFSISCPELSRAFMGIAVCELRHLMLLGELLVSLGGDPRFFCCLPTNSIAGGWWNAHPVTLSYHSTTDAALKSGISAKKGSIAEYKSISEYIDDGNIRLLLKRIIADEELHLETLESLYTRFCS